eukprot:g2663.t1
MRVLSKEEMKLVSGGEASRTLGTVNVFGTRGGGFDPWDFHYEDDSDYYDDYGDSDGGDNSSDSSDDQNESVSAEQFMEMLVNGEITDLEELHEILDKMPADALGQLGDFISALEGYADRNIDILNNLGGSALDYVDEWQNLKKGLGVIGGVIEIVTLGNDLSDGEFTYEEQGDAVAAIAAIAVGAAVGGPFGFAGGIIVSLFGDDVYEELAPHLVNGAELTAEQFDAFLERTVDNYQGYMEEIPEDIPVDEDTGTINWGDIFGGSSGYDELFDRGEEWRGGN